MIKSKNPSKIKKINTIIENRYKLWKRSKKESIFELW